MGGSGHCDALSWTDVRLPLKYIEVFGNACKLKHACASCGSSAPGHRSNH
jgi:hypothetical protein